MASRSDRSAGAVSLDSFNEQAAQCPINSPRSLAAMHRLGISAAELQYRPPSHRSFVEGVDSQTAELVQDYVQRRFEHFEHKRQAKIQALREERQAAIREEMESGDGPLASHRSGSSNGESRLVAQARDRASTAIEMEKEEIARMQQRLFTKLNNALAFEIRRAQTLDRAQSKVEYANHRAEAEKQHRADLQAEKELQAQQAVSEQQRRLAQEAEARRALNEQAWADSQRLAAAKQEQERERRRLEKQAQADMRDRAEEKRLHLESIQENQRQHARAKEAELARKEEERIRGVEEQRRQLAEFHAEQQRHLQTKLEHAGSRAAQLAEAKRRRFEEKEAAAEAKRREYEEDRAWEREQVRRRALDKEEHLRATQAQAEAILRSKAETTLAKEQAVAERLAQRQRDRALEEEERRSWLADREAARRKVLESSVHRREERGNAILSKRAESDARSDQAMRKREAEIKQRKLSEQLLAEDRKEQVARMARIQQNQRDQLLARIQADRERVDSLQNQSLQLTQQRAKLRDMAERQQVQVLEQFARLRADPSKLKHLDPTNVDVVRMGFLSQAQAAKLMSFRSALALLQAPHRTHTHAPRSTHAQPLYSPAL